MSEEISPPSLGIISWVVLFLLALWFWRRVLKISALDFLKAIIAEFAQLLTLKPTPGALNALGLIALIALASVLGFSNSFWDVFSFSNGEAISRNQEKYWVLLSLVAFIGFKSLVCVALCK